MSLMHEAIVAEKFGLRLTIEQLADAINIPKGTIYNRISAGRFPVKTYLDGAKRFADYRDVAQYLDECRGRAESRA